MTPSATLRTLILGGTSGIGLASALELQNRGHDVTVTGRNQERAERIRKEHPGLQVETADAASEADLSTLFAKLGTIDHLVLCVSGSKGAGPLETLSLKDLREGFECKFFPQVLATQLALPYLAKDASITYVTAISARAANPGTAGLAAINGALESMIKPLARELKPRRVNAVSPGVVETPWWDQLPEELRKQLLEQSAAATLVGRNGTPTELGQTIAFVVTNGFVSGTVLEVDGGLRLS